MTIVIPTPPTDLVSQIETATIETLDDETKAVAALREKFAAYAKHNGYIKIADYQCRDSNFSRSEELYYRQGGKRVRALLVDDDFSSNSSNQNSGQYTGTRLYLTESGEWLKIERSGHWSNWQGTPCSWGCGVSASPNDSDNHEYDYAIEQSGEDVQRGYVKTLSDERVAAQHDISEMLSGLTKSMTETCEKLPQRYAKLKQRAELARNILEALA